MQGYFGTAMQLSPQQERELRAQQRKGLMNTGRKNGASAMLLTTLVGGLGAHFALGGDKAFWGYLGGLLAGYGYNYAKIMGNT